MNGQYNEAYADAQKMTNVAPASMIGYARVGHLLSMYGHQISSTVGADGDEHSSRSNNNRNFRASQQQQQRQQHHHKTNPQPIEETNNISSLEISRQGRKHYQTNQYSMEETNKDLERIGNGGGGVRTKLLRINTSDPLRSFPDGITKTIITLLPQNDRLVCIQVSKLWRKEILSCAEAWQSLLLGFYRVNNIPLIHLLHFLYDHVKTLRIGSRTTENIQSHIFKALQNGYFLNIQALSLYAPEKTVIQNMDQYTADISNALYSIRNTLTRLNINFSRDYDINPTITIATILESCRNLADLIYHNTNTELSTFIGNLATLDNHRHLVSLELNAEAISKQDIESIIQICRQLRRINIGNYCGDIAVLDMFLTQTATSNLEILGINKYVIDGVPQLTEKEDSNWRETGLRVLWITQKFSDELSVSYETKIFQLMHQNRTTLEAVNVTLPRTTTTMNNEIFKLDHPDLNFEKIKSLTFYSSPNIMNRFQIYQSVRKSITLKHLELGGLPSTDKLADILLKKPPLERLSIIGRSEADEYLTNSESLNKLFARYLSFSLLESLHLERQLKVSDVTLITVAGIKSLKKITFIDLPLVSTNDIKNFFYIIGYHLTNVSLENMTCITDDVLAVLGEQGNDLSSVTLENLDRVTDQGVKTLIDTSRLRLEMLRIRRCKKTTEDCKVDPQRKIKYIDYA
ncbi:hypothetical protein BDA99DRAFT_508063 [Phascolomyces articulosus]|uniref:F-box domain-containing protein n=1 Tax=Phascolomyces articulosus TaxID=60185 RepID=A0AAD5K248_9FUNG|nr:hypothetical protein BDA99DRAFT_508063 [Phascolomyces articulosus]